MEKDTKKTELQDKDLEQVVGGLSTLTFDPFPNSKPLSPEETHYNFVHDLIFEHYYEMIGEGSSHESFIIWAQIYVETDYKNGNLSWSNYQYLLDLISKL